ncbi:MAG: hypothetical protein QM605_15385 [Sphingobium sp.]
MIRLDDPARARWGVTFRVLAGTIGAYGLASLATVVLSLVMATLGMDRVEAVYAATIASFAIFAVIAIAVFHTRSARRAWDWLLAFAVPLGLLSWLLMPGTTP